MPKAGGHILMTDVQRWFSSSGFKIWTQQVADIQEVLLYINEDRSIFLDAFTVVSLNNGLIGESS